MESCCKHEVMSIISFLFLLFLWKKKKCIIFAVHSIFLNYSTEPSSVSQVGADPEENPLMPFWDNGKLSWMCWSWLNLLKNYLIFRFGNKQTECLHWGFVFSWSSVLLEVPMSSVGCLLPRVFLDIQMMWTAKEQASPPSPAVLLLFLTDAWQAQPCAVNSTERTCYFTKTPEI